MSELRPHELTGLVAQLVSRGVVLHQQAFLHRHPHGQPRRAPQGPQGPQLHGAAVGEAEDLAGGQLLHGEAPQVVPAVADSGPGRLRGRVRGGLGRGLGGGGLWGGLGLSV